MSRVFTCHFNRVHMQRGLPTIWTVHHRGQCIPATKVTINVPVETIYKGTSARQPRAYFKGRGEVTLHGSEVTIG